MTITIFEVQYEGTPDNYQSRIIEVEDWNTYVENVKNYRAHNSLYYTIPKTTKPINMIERHEQLEFDYIVLLMEN